MIGRGTEVLGENLPHCHFIHHKSYITWPAVNSGRRGGKPVNNHLSYGTVFLPFYCEFVPESLHMVYTCNI
jgi:hypothetical protein